MRSGSTAKVLAECKLKYNRISQCPAGLNLSSQAHAMRAWEGHCFISSWMCAVLLNVDERGAGSCGSVWNARAERGHGLWPGDHCSSGSGLPTGCSRCRRHGLFCPQCHDLLRYVDWALLRPVTRSAFSHVLWIFQLSFAESQVVRSINRRQLEKCAGGNVHVTMVIAISIALRINFHRGLRLPLVHDLVPLKGHCYFSWCAQHLHARSLCTFFHMTFQHYNLTSLDAISEAVCSMSVGLFPCCVTFCMGMAQFQGQMALACIL